MQSDTSDYDSEDKMTMSHEITIASCSISASIVNDSDLDTTANNLHKFSIPIDRLSESKRKLEEPSSTALPKVILFQSLK